MCCNAAVAVYCVLLFAVLSTTIGIFSDQFSLRNDNGLYHTCISLWGLSPSCQTDAFGSSDLDDLFSRCSTRENRFGFARLFILLSLGLMIAALVLGLVLSFCCHQCMQWVCLFFNVGSAVCGVISIALLVDAYSNFGSNPIDELTPYCEPLRFLFSYDAGFICLCTGFGLNVLFMIVFIRNLTH